MRIKLGGEILSARINGRAVQVTAEVITTYDYPVPHNMRTMLAKRDGERWSFTGNSSQAYISLAVAVHTLPSVRSTL